MDSGSSLELFGRGSSRWLRPYFLLRELGIEFVAREVQRDGSDPNSAVLRAHNPTGKIPVLVDGGQVICESGAIVLYLADKFADRGLVPTPGTPARGVHDQWFFFVHTELEPPLWSLHKHVRRGEGSQATAALARNGIARAATVLEAHLEGRDFVGERFQAVDVVLGCLLTWGVAQESLTRFPTLAAYRDRIVARPAFPAQLLL